MERFQYPRKSSIPMILEDFHLDHPGENDMAISIRQEYFWDRMYQDIKQFRKSCHHCQVDSAKMPQPQRELQPIVPPESPLQHIGIDLFVDMPTNELGYKHVLVAVCYLSKYVVARPLKTKTTSEVVAVLLSIYLTFGVPNKCQHDQGREFTSKEFKDLHEQLGVNNTHTTAYYPQSNGLVESHNKILKRKMEKLRKTSDGSWVAKLPFAVIAANTKIKKATKYSAFELMFGRKCNSIPLLKVSKNYSTYPDEDQSKDNDSENSDSLDDPFAIENGNTDAIGDEMDFIRQQNESEAHLNIKIEQARQKRIYDKKVKINRSDFQEVDMFLVRNIKKDKKLPNTKTQPKYLGPFQVHSVTKSHLHSRKGNTTLGKVSHPIHLAKKYVQREQEQSHTTEACLSESQTTDQISLFPSKAIETGKKRNTTTQSLSDCKRSKTASDSEQYIYGISRESILDELNFLRDDVIRKLKGNLYISPLHETLHNTKRKQMCPTVTIIFNVLKDISPFEMREEVMDILQHWAEEAYAGKYENLTLQSKHCIDYSHMVLYPVICQHLELEFSMKFASDTENFPFKLPPLCQIGPFFHPVTENWQKEKCQLLDINFTSAFTQHPSLNGCLLSKIIPWQTEKIGMDGNCFFRCISMILSGSETHHVKLRAEICRYMVTEGKPIIKRYLKTLGQNASPISYLRSSTMTQNAIWATDVEIMAVSCMLDSDVYICTEQDDARNFSRRKTWNRYSGCQNHTRNPHSISLFILNLDNKHYEPVVRLINSEYESFRVLHANDDCEDLTEDKPDEGFK